MSLKRQVLRRMETRRGGWNKSTREVLNSSPLPTPDLALPSFTGSEAPRLDLQGTNGVIDLFYRPPSKPCQSAHQNGLLLDELLGPLRSTPLFGGRHPSRTN